MGIVHSGMWATTQLVSNMLTSMSWVFSPCSSRSIFQPSTGTLPVQTASSAHLSQLFQHQQENRSLGEERHQGIPPPTNFLLPLGLLPRSTHFPQTRALAGCLQLHSSTGKVTACHSRSFNSFLMLLYFGSLNTSCVCLYPSSHLYKYLISFLIKNFKVVVSILFYVSFRYTGEWLDIYIINEVISLISLVSTWLYY